MPPKKGKRRNQPLQAPIAPKEVSPEKEEDTPAPTETEDAVPATSASPDPSQNSDSATSRLDRFKALRAKLAESTKANHAAVIAEHKRMKIDPSAITKLERKKAEAELKLAKQDAEDAGDDFERKRAWDWTIEESLAWDRKQAGKQANREESGFSDYTQAAEKMYMKDVKGFKPDLEAYKKAKEEALAKGQVVLQNGEMVAVDEDRRFYADANSLGLHEHKPSREALDRLVEETKKREADREAKRRKKRATDDTDISYINKRNKVFNEKLARYAIPLEAELTVDFTINIPGKHGRHSNEGVVFSLQASVY